VDFLCLKIPTARFWHPGYDAISVRESRKRGEGPLVQRRSSGGKGAVEARLCPAKLLHNRNSFLDLVGPAPKLRCRNS
jgi:hypothetical protein